MAKNMLSVIHFFASVIKNYTPKSIGVTPENILALQRKNAFLKQEISRLSRGKTALLTKIHNTSAIA